MADENNVEMENTDCGASCGDGAGSDCCGTSGGSGSGGGGAWKSIIFVFIIVLAGTVAARSLLKDSGAGADGGACPLPCISEDQAQCGGGEKVACDKAGAEDEACAKKVACDKAGAEDEACVKKASCPMSGSGEKAETSACPVSGSPSLVDAPCSSNADAENADAGCCP